MRIWSLHPKYLDTKGIVALWRETLLAKNVLAGRTKGYLNHPQLDRFKAMDKPIDAINQYLSEVYFEAERRQYNFNKQKIDWDFTSTKIAVTSSQMDYEMSHLLKKLKIRDIQRYNELSQLTLIEPHPIFEIVEGEIEKWEKNK